MTRPALELPLREQAALFGKLPWAADFVRIHHTQPAAIELDRWLQASTQPLARARAGWPAQRVHFVYAAPGCATRLAGVLAPSRDRAGRRFPVCVFARVPSPAHEARCELAALPRSLSPFLSAVEQLLERSSALERADVERALGELPLPRSSGIERVAAELASRSASQLAHALFAGDARAQALAAWSSLLRIDADWRAHSFARAPVLAAPLRSLSSLEAWLALAGQVRADGMRAASVFWTPHAPQPRMLLALGALPAALPLWLAQPSVRGERLLSLTGTELRSPLTVRDEDWQLSGERFTARVAQLLAGLPRTR